MYVGLPKASRHSLGIVNLFLGSRLWQKVSTRPFIARFTSVFSIFSAIFTIREINPYSPTSTHIMTHHPTKCKHKFFLWKTAASAKPLKRLVVNLGDLRISLPRVNRNANCQRESLGSNHLKFRSIIGIAGHWLSNHRNSTSVTEIDSKRLRYITHLR